ncbi:MAG: catalase family peroxidase [Planctomycetota bacterium]
MSSHSTPRPTPRNPLAEQILTGLDAVFGYHPGHRAVHAKGAMCQGTFVPTSAATALTRAPHFSLPSTPVLARFSDFAGIPSIPDNDPQGAGPRGMAVRFQLGEHVHTDIIAHSHDGFPVHTGEEFLEFVQALAASGPEASKPTPIEKFLASHPAGLRFANTPKPIPTSFAREAYFGVSAIKFTNRENAVRFGRYRLLPTEGTSYLTDAEASNQSADFLMQELAERLARGSVQYRLTVQLAEAGDNVDDATSHWSDTREEVVLGTLTLKERLDDQQPDLRKIIFDPIPRVEGLEPTNDPLWNLRADIYLLSGRRRRAASQ